LNGVRVAETDPDHPTDASHGPPSAPSDRLDSWKEISAYLKRDVRTLRRWEKGQGLPVHRHLHKKLGSVYAYKTELDAWWHKGGAKAETEPSQEQAAPEEPTPDRADATGDRRWRVSGLWLLGSGLAVAVIAFWFGSWRVQPPDARSFALQPLQLTFHSGEWSLVAQSISPDGKYLAYADETGLLVQTVLTGAEARLPLPAGVGPIQDLAWHPDSNALFIAGTSGIWRTSVLRETPSQVVSGSGLMAVSPDGKWLAIRDAAVSRIRIGSARGEDVHEVVPPEPNQTVSRPTWSPDARRIAYARYWWTGSPPQRRVIESRHRDGSQPTVVAEVAGILSQIWSPDGRILYSIPKSAPNSRFTDLWSIRVEAATGLPMGEPTLVHSVPGMKYERPSLTGDGSRLTFLLNRLHIGVYVGGFDPARRELRGVERAVFSSALSWPIAWTPSGDALLFQSELGPGLTMFRQTVGTPEPTPIMAQPRLTRDVPIAVFSPDGKWLLYVWTQQPGGLMRMPASGGPPEKLFDLTSARRWLRCALPPSRVCGFGELAGGRLRLTVFDPAVPGSAHHAELPGPQSPSNWDLSPDGTSVVAVIRTDGGSARLFVLNLGTEQASELRDKAWRNAETVAWLPDGSGWIVTCTLGERGGEVLFVDQQGRPRTLWKSTFQRLWSPAISPDGRRIAFASGMTETNVWMLQEF
jgi:Tol biopolymer transport system component